MTDLLECLENGAGTCRNSDYFEELLARAEAAEANAKRLAAIVMLQLAEIERFRLALGGDPDSDLVSLATTLKAEYDKLEERVAMDWAGFF